METVAQWLDNNMLQCPTKALIGLDCPGCGFQRAFAALLRGDFVEVWEHYPPIFPFLVMLLILILYLRTGIRSTRPLLLASLVGTALAILINYGYNMAHML